VAILTDWIRAGESGTSAGSAGAGKSNLFGFLCHRPEVILSVPKLILVQVDSSNLPGDDPATFYRLILHALCEAQAELAAVEPALASIADPPYRRVEDKIDPLLTPERLARGAPFILRKRYGHDMASSECGV
jgi:hypothetical protein